MSSALAAVPAAVEVIPLNGHIGAEIRGVHLSRISPEHFAALLDWAERSATEERLLALPPLLRDLEFERFR